MKNFSAIRIAQHLLFWLAFWLLISVSNGLYDNDFWTVGLYNLCRLPMTMSVTYVLVYGVVPLYYQNQRALAVSLGLMALILAVLLDRLMIQYLLFPLFYADSDYSFVFWDWYRLSGFFVHVLTTMGIIAGFKYYRDWQRSESKIKELSDEKRRAELQFLRAQTHPHFLFNALNAIYYEAGKDTLKTQELILQFSDFLRFTLQDSDAESIPIDREEALIRNYIALQQSRFGERISVQIDWQVEGNERLPPMICFFLVENAFKHGALEHGGNSHVHIAMQRKGETLELRVENPLAEQKAADPLQSREGIGLRNLRRQLDLLYGSDYRYTVERHDARYACTLQIPLSHG